MEHMINVSKNRVSSDTPVANYFGLRVVVLWKMENCCLICCGDRELVVETSDLVFQKTAPNAA
jgi:hypothetical protein